jgi:hypothetical protein
MSSLFNYFSDAFGSLFKGKGKSPEQLRKEGGVLAVRMLQDARVQTELGLSPEQTSQVLALVHEAREKHKPKGAGGRGQGPGPRGQGPGPRGQGPGPRGQGQGRGGGAGARMAAVAAEVLEGLNKGRVLTEQQQARLRQILWQNRGPAAFLDPALQEALGLSESQKQAIQGVIEDHRRRAMQAGRGAAGGDEDRRERVATIRHEGLAKALTLLTAEQKQRWEELKGQPFEVKLEPPGGGPSDQEELE